MRTPVASLVDSTESITRRRRRSQEPRGSTGTRVMNGRIIEEYLAEWTGNAGVDNVNEMRRSDSFLRALWLTTTSLIEAAEITVKRYGVDPEKSLKRDVVKATEIRDFWETALFGNMARRPFAEMMHETMLCLAFGFIVQEWQTRYDEKKEVLWLRDVHLRHPRTINNANKPWVMEGDDLLGVNQLDVYSQDGFNTKEVFLPRDTILLMTNEQEGSDYSGVSWYRSCWRPYFAKKVLVQIALIGAERMAIGFPVAKMGSSFSKRRLRELIQLVTNIRVGADNGAVLSNEEAIEILEGKLDMDKLMVKIEFCNSEMARAWRADFILLGQGNTKGGYSLSSDKTDLYMVSQYALANAIGNKYRADVMYPITVLNFGEENANDYLPTLSFDINRENAAQIVDMFFKLCSGENPVFTESEVDEDWIRRRLHVPERTMPRRPFQGRVVPPPGGDQPPQSTDKDAEPKDEK